MHFIWSIILGAIAGTIAERILNFNFGWILTIILGIVGAVVGDWLLISLLHLPLPDGTIGSLIAAVVGAVVVLFAYKAIAGRS